MYELIENTPLPQACQKCSTLADCGNCEHALERWHFDDKDKLLAKKTLLTKQIKRLQRQLEEINVGLSVLEKEAREDEIWTNIMSKYGEALGQQYIEEAKQLNNDPSFVYPKSLDRKVKVAINRAFAEKKKRGEL